MSPPDHSPEATDTLDGLQHGIGDGAAAAKTSDQPEVAPESRKDGPTDHIDSVADAHSGNMDTEKQTSEAENHGSTPEDEKQILNDMATTEHQASASIAKLTGEEGSYPAHEAMESSTATLRPGPQHTSNFLSPHPEFKEVTYLDPTPATPMHSATPSRSNSKASSKDDYLQHHRDRSPARSDAGFDERHTSEDEPEGQSKMEIQTIMEQFGEDGSGPSQDEIMSPRLEFAEQPLLGPPLQHPPRRSSLEPLSQDTLKAIRGMEGLGLVSPDASHHSGQDSDLGPPVPPKPESIRSFKTPTKANQDLHMSVDTTPQPPTPMHRPPPPEPEPEPALPFDFHRFLEQLRHRTADPVAKFLRSFLQEFGKKEWMVHEQVKIISDFLAFITNKMGQCEVWREVSDAEFDNAREGMEKLVMNRLYTQTFSPAIPPPQPIPGPKGKKKNAGPQFGPGRRGQHQEDVERDDILAQKIGIYGWVKEEHLDIPPVGEGGKRFLVLAEQELLKIKTYRAPRDKIICVLNCCKVIFGLLKHSKSDSSADSFMPLLIYVVLHANPEHLVSNVQYILRFRNQEKLGGEAGYYLSSLMGAVQFIENIDRTSLTISDADFEQNVEAAVSAIAEKHRAEEPRPPGPPVPPVHVSEKSAPSRPEVTPRHSMEAESSTPRRSISSNDDSGDGFDEKAAISGLLKTIQKPLSSIGRIFSDEGPSSQGERARTPSSGNTARLSPTPRRSPDLQKKSSQQSLHHSRRTAEDAAARQASAEAEQARRIQRAEYSNVVETLAGMFPDLDREVIGDVVRQKEGRVGLAVDACLALSS